MEATNELTAVMLNVNDIVQSDAKIREVDENAKEFPGLLKSITASGVLQPVTVREIVEDGQIIKGKYELVDGGNRLRCAELAGHPTIPANIYSNVSNDELIKRQVILNMYRIPQKASEIVAVIKLYSARHEDLTQREVAAWFDMNESTFGQILRLKNLTSAAMALVDGGQIALTKSFHLAKLAPEDQTEEIFVFAQQENIEDFSARVKRIRQDKAAERKGLPKKEGFDPKLMKKAEIESFWAKTVYDFESLSPDDEGYQAVAGAKLAMDHIFQVDAECIAARQADEDEKKEKRTLVSTKKEIEKQQARLDQMNKDLAKAEANQPEEVVGV